MHLLLYLLQNSWQLAPAAPQPPHTPGAAGGQSERQLLAQCTLGLSWLTLVMGAVCGGTVEGAVDYGAAQLFQYAGGTLFALAWTSAAALGPGLTPAVTLCNGPDSAPPFAATARFTTVPLTTVRPFGSVWQVPPRVPL